MIRHRIKGYFACLTVLVVYAVSVASANTALPVKDIRVVIDMSGSMKKNDPLNHRTKAVQLFSQVLPGGVQSGIWTFASEVNMLIKHGKVNKAWKKSAFDKAKKIHSYGLFTNIEKALKKSTDDWYKKEPGKEKHLILLTDGYIDISKNIDKNIQSRKQVINELLPLFKKNNIHIHSIALSDQADHKLLKLLASKTNGSYVVIKKASDLDRYFFKLFQSTAKPDTIPFKGNRFKIDKSISDMTVVLFNADNPTRILTPEKKYWSNEKHPKNVKWVKSDNYEIVTVSNPQEGAWYVDAPVDPDNKIMIVTNLRLHVNKMPSILLPDNSVSISAYMTEDGKIITKENFIKILKVRSSIRQINALTKDSLKMIYDGKGRFNSNFDTSKYKQQNILSVTVKGPTFIREYQHEFTIVTDPVLLESILNGKNIIIKAYVDDRVIDNKNIHLQILDHEKDYLFTAHDKFWQAKLPASFSGQPIKITVSAKLHNDKSFSQTIEINLPKIINKKAIEKKPDPVKSKKITHEKEKKETHGEKIPTETESFNWIIVFILVLVVNITLIIGGYFIYKKIKKMSKNTPSIDIEDKDTEETKPQAEDTDNIDGLEEIEDIEDANEKKSEDNNEA